MSTLHTFNVNVRPDTWDLPSLCIRERVNCIPNNLPRMIVLWTHTCYMDSHTTHYLHPHSLLRAQARAQPTTAVGPAASLNCAVVHDDSIYQL